MGLIIYAMIWEESPRLHVTMSVTIMGRHRLPVNVDKLKIDQTKRIQTIQIRKLQNKIELSGYKIT
ncbi:unnamed protein product, partial [Callosobruchus maculatus]